ncbi:glucose-repressible alcohol dehydrogenase transcriptional effector [Lingula anatina]|uniref:Glucose-repressible alcohol dehydrogenase transcriptional effector n=1 Tax=Lingula anatina TaxID=7574 RepID=A0A1S3J778_LINAN|nr:glucose-repressible alcohol dehydrogenase transcriptional effector [Lingula anatina]|eukprot:XP_013406255.1 glucose-repressible alcohol dehydrogenase transcriptional effector [Lingula anatina]
MEEAQTSVMSFTPYPRKWIEKSPKPDAVFKENGFTAVSYNLLADCAVRNLVGYHSYVAKHALYMDFRLPRILKELAELDGDIVAMQEVEGEVFFKGLVPALGKLGYKGVHLQRRDDLGLSLFFKTNKFSLLDQKCCTLHDLAETTLQVTPMSTEQRNEVRTYIERPSAFLLAKLKHKGTNRVLTVGNIHTVWDSMKYQTVTLLQVISAVRELVAFAGGAQQPHLILGDFNSIPGGPVYRYMNDGKLDEEMKKILRQEEPVEVPDVGSWQLLDLLPTDSLTRNPMQCKSAYLEIMGKEPSITNCDDACQDGRFDGCLDYIWYSHESISALGVLETPSSEPIMRFHALPSDLFPSDHIPIKAQFRFNMQTPQSVI